MILTPRFKNCQYLSGFPPGMFERGGSKRGGGSGGPPSGEKISKFEILVLEMAYLNRNDSKIWKLFSFSSPTRGGDIPPLVLTGGSGPPWTPPWRKPCLFNKKNYFSSDYSRRFS